MLISVNKSARILSMWGSKLKYNRLFFNGCVILSGAYYVLNHLNIACAHMLHHNALRLTREGRGHEMHRGKVTFYMCACTSATRHTIYMQGGMVDDTVFA